ncbi:hypothetical protein ACIBU0_33130 [Streptomyces sp. NPDC049627]|uniref:Rv1733c family protein n=1 Tax=Streptomyces sp. NPDC049627 TaxID=3365595 RepID=UPI00379515DB
MSDGTCTKKRFWRWRGNPLRRRADIVEAWVVLAVWTVVLVAGTLAGLVTAHAADEQFERQRAERHSVRAVLLVDVPDTAASTTRRGLGKVRWTTADGTTHTDTTLVATGQKAGAKVTVWLDGRGGLASEPPSRAEAAVEAGVLGTAAALAAVGGVLGTGALVRWRLERRRIAEWGREWELVGPRWSQKTG